MLFIIINKIEYQLDACLMKPISLEEQQGKICLGRVFCNRVNIEWRLVYLFWRTIANIISHFMHFRIYGGVCTIFFSTTSFSTTSKLYPKFTTFSIKFFHLFYIWWLFSFIKDCCVSCFLIFQGGFHCCFLFSIFRIFVYDLLLPNEIKGFPNLF
jgi:hypothetical protein